MKTKQPKEEPDHSTDEATAAEPKTRARKKASDVIEEDKNKAVSDEAKTSKEPKRGVGRPRTVVKKKPLGIRKALRSKKGAVVKEAAKTIIKQTAKRGRKPMIKTEPPDDFPDKETIPLIPASEIKKEPVDEPQPNSRSSSPRTTGRRQRITSDLAMMKAVLADSSSTLILGPRTSYSMRSERSNSPSAAEAKSLRGRKPRKARTNLLNEVVMKEQKKRRRLLSESKAVDGSEATEEAKKLKRDRSCSRDGSEISKCSDITESDLSLNESLPETEGKELNKKLVKPKTDLDIDIENNVQISTNEKVPSLNVDSKLAETKQDTGPSNICNIKERNKKLLSLKRSTSLDSDNNNSNRIKLDKLNSSDAEDKSPSKTETDTLFDARSHILTSMSKTFNSREVSKNMWKARRGRKAATATRTSAGRGRNGVSGVSATATATSEPTEEKQETLESLSKEIDDLINDLDQNNDRERTVTNVSTSVENASEPSQTKTVAKSHSISKPLGDNNSIITPETPVKDKESITAESTPSKIDDTENIRLHYEDDSVDKPVDSPKQEVSYKCSTVASIDKLMDRLKEFEEFDKRRQRQESESKPTDSKPMMVTNDVVLIPKSGADIKLKDIQTVRSPERPIEKENLLSCFENNSAISIVKRDHVRKSIDIDLTNSVTLIKRNSISARKESTGSNHSRENDAISIFEKSLGKDVTLTEIRKSVDKPPVIPVDLHQFATLHPNNPSLAGVILDSNQISITPRVNDFTKRGSRDSISRKSSESGVEVDERMATIEKIKSPIHVKSMDVSITPTPVAIKSPEAVQPMETEALAPPLEIVKVPEDIATVIKTSETAEVPKEDTLPTEIPVVKPNEIVEKPAEEKPAEEKPAEENLPEEKPYEEKPSEEIPPEEKPAEEKLAEETPAVVTAAEPEPAKIEKVEDSSVEQKAVEETSIAETLVPEIQPKTEVPTESSENKEKVEKIEPMEVDQQVETKVKTPEKKEKPETKSSAKAKGVKAEKGNKSARNSVESQPGSSNILLETPESQKRKENVLKTLGLLTHKAAKEATIEKLKERERIYGSNYGGIMNKNKAVKSSGDYTGTLKTVIKLNRGAGGEREKKRVRSSLKMTFQKSKSRGKLGPEVGEETNEDEAYYTIERREAAAASSEGGHRKPYSNRLNHDTEAVPEPTEPKEILNLVIPEKASSFSIHPGRLCMDQCFYCGGKFGLFDTPCHIAQMKSADRQKKVLDNEEKLAIDSCLCDACYRHVDRRANCPSYRKKPPPGAVGGAPRAPGNQGPSDADHSLNQSNADKGVSPPLEDESEEETSAATSARGAICHTLGCGAPADHAIRRKWLIKMRSAVNKLLQLEGDYPGLHTIPLCGPHHRALAPLLACTLCRRKLTKHHNAHLMLNYEELNPLLKAVGLPLQMTDRFVACKLCRYYCSLLLRGTLDHQSDQYSRKLLQIHNIEIPPQIQLPQPQPQQVTSQDETSQDDPNSSKNKKKQRVKSKGRKSADPDKPPDSGSSEKTESSPEKDKSIHEDKIPPLDEDIESLISSNKILVPGAKQLKEGNEAPQTENSDPENAMDFDMPMLPVDKQTELQYLLQKQNNPAQFLQNSNLTQKQKNIVKLNMTGIQKPGLQQRIHDKNARRLHKLGQLMMKEKDVESESDKEKQTGVAAIKNLTLNEECTIESIPNKKPADINTLKNKWQMSESFTQVKKNLSELSKKLTIEKEPKKQEPKYSNPVKRLETNPSISVRELFPGEEEMNLQCNIEFNNVKSLTPEGWEKCNTTIQYDSETKKLWNELQRPYGNQSSFLRHLILLEKYFRNGDLVLAQNATIHAANYSDSVQSRLRAYDNIASDAPRRSEPAISLIEYRKKPSVNGKSLLKTNQSDFEREPRKTMPPPSSLPKANKFPKEKKSKQLPPELIAINTPNAQGRKAIQNVLHNIQQLVKGVSAADPTEVAAAPLPVAPVAPPKVDLPPPPPPPPPPKEKKDSPKDTPKKSKPTSKPWRPTLMPITPENEARIAREPKQIAVDGRSLPSLVQVMSSGQRYHITLHDYNKMCIMRREKLQQLQDGDKSKKAEDNTVVTEIQPSTTHGNGGTVVQTIQPDSDKKELPELKQISSNAANILKNVGLKNITIAPIPAKTATVTSSTPASPSVSSPSLIVTSTPMKLPQLPSVSITSETVLTPTLPLSSGMIMPKIPKSLTVIPQTMVPATQSILIPHSVALSQAIVAQNVIPQSVAVPQGVVVPQMVVPTSQVVDQRP